MWQKTNRDILEINSRLDQLDLRDIYRISHLTTTEYIFFPSAYGTFSEIDHTLSHKAILNALKKIKTIPRNFLDQSGIKIEINTKRNPNTWKLNNLFLKDFWVNKKK